MLLAVAWVTACSENEELRPSFESELTEITSATENGITVTLLATEDFFVGYNTVSAKIEDEDGNLLSGDISVMPMMDMMTMSHSSPIEFPSGNTFENGVFSFNPVFVMPSDEMGTWSLNFTVNELQVRVPVDVAAPPLARLVSFTSMLDESTKYFVAYMDPKDPEVGENDLVIAVYKRQSMMEWPAVTGLAFYMEPWMVSMDHGSPNNVSPAHIGSGHYKGKVNFTMTGDWQVRLTMKENNEVCGNPYFDLNFQ